MKNPNLESFNQFWIDNSSEEVPPMPKKASDMSITMQEKMRMTNPKLYQNLFKVDLDSGMLPADLEMRLRNNSLWVEDADRLRKYGWEYESQRIEQAKEQYKQEKMLKEIEESKQRQKVAEQKREAWKNMNLMERMAAEPLTQDQILRNRKRYGVGQ
jgi:hypothetical protein|tara:strand:+ start:518 stop:988 length:471 start_codon:yes stop_codon:yes gene_type:complete